MNQSYAQKSFSKIQNFQDRKIFEKSLPVITEVKFSKIDRIKFRDWF